MYKHFDKMDTTRLAVFKMGEEPPEWHHWITRPPLERLAAGELLRQRVYGHAALNAPFPKVVRYLKLGES